VQNNQSQQVAETIRVEMTRRRVTQTNLAETLNVSHQWVHNRLASKVSPSVDDLVRIAEALKLGDWRDLTTRCAS
jgi:transcriptional regulator with XRE-family HTH domain